MSVVIQPTEQAGSVPAVACAALAVAAKNLAKKTRHTLKPGRQQVDLTVRVHGTLSVGHNGTTSSTVTPEQNEVVAYLLSHMNKRTRQKILRELPTEFAKLGQVPPVDKELTADAATLLASLRKKVQTPRKGAVTGEFELEVESCHINGQSAQLAVVG